MSTPTAAELSLINDTEFLEELEQFDPTNARTPDPSIDPHPLFDDAYDALEGGLPIDPKAPANTAPHYEREQPTVDPYNDPASPGEPVDRHISMTAAALVIAACLTAGAASAAYVFHARLPWVTASRPASR